MIRRWGAATVAPLVLAFFWLSVVGLISIRAEAMKRGGIVDWNNQLDSVTDPGVPWLQYVAIGLLSASVFYGCLRAAHLARARLGLLLGAVLLVAAAVWALVTTRFPNEGGIDSPDAPVIAWLRWGGLNPATFAVAGGLLALAMRPLSLRVPASRDT